MSLDESQQRIIDIEAERALVLAGPGCGKTHLLCRRIIKAHADGRPFDDMICLSFTNRASREMSQRIIAEIGNRPEGLFVGNIHRFCIRFLYDNLFLPSRTSIIDEEDRDLWLAENLGLRRLTDRKQVLDIAMLLYQQEHNFPTEVMRKLSFATSASQIAVAQAYIDYKNDNMLVDFDDLLLMTYNALNVDHSEIELKHTGYHWAQVDEVQDLTPLQLAIIDKITSHEKPTVVFLGDEQQAIFEFLGAGGPALDKLKKSCSGHIYRLNRNYRSPSYLVNLCNDFAILRMGISPADLPTPDRIDEKESDDLQLLESNSNFHDNAVAAKIRSWRNAYPDESIAVLVQTNDEAERLSTCMTHNGLDHLLVSRKDLFKQVSYKTVYAHLAVAANRMRTVEWSRLLYQTGAVRTLAEARSAVYNLRQAGATPDDLISDNGCSTLGFFCNTYRDGNIVVFDTETTGLDVYSDDVVQISAIKYNRGKRVSGETFNIFIESDRTLPTTMSNGKANPLVKIYAQVPKVQPIEALSQFSKFVGDAVLCGHNVTFDCRILANNYRRYAPDIKMPALTNLCIDSLAISRLLFPRIRNHNLQAMLDILDIDAVNSHLADDDTAATADLIDTLYPIANKQLINQSSLLAMPLMQHVAERLRHNYKPLYDHTRKLMSHDEIDDTNTLANEMDYVYREMVGAKFITPIQRWKSVIEFIGGLVATFSINHRFFDQLNAHINELRTFNEGDIVAAGKSLHEITISTVHKAKGLEFDNVIVYDASEKGWDKPAERDRVLYVAFSRAKRRLAVFYSGWLNESVNAVAHHFNRLDQLEVEASALVERLNSRTNKGY